MADDKKTEENLETPVSTVDDILSSVSEKINDAESILVALSKDPSVDEMTAAIGMTLALDKMGKHAIAIYSGKTPNALEFLKPEDTFESNTNSLQDFIIALNKEKVDHLRYKIEGDFVKVYITPYKSTISDKDLEFSHGEVNVDLIISFDVEEIEDLDAALEKHGRIMHNAGSVNISNDKPGRIGGVEWTKPEASSVSEMVAELFEYMGQDMGKSVATALLTGIVAATERFSNEKTTPSAMTIASSLMKNGADQQLIISNINKKGEKEAPASEEAETENVDGADSIEIKHGEEGEEEKQPEESAEAQLEKMLGVKKDDGTAQPASPQQVMDELRAVAAGNAQAESPAGATAPAAPEVPKSPESVLAAQVPQVGNGMTDLPTETFKPLASDTISEFAPRGGDTIEPEKSDTVAEVATSGVPAAEVYGVGEDRTTLHDGKIEITDNIARPKDYSKMMEEALGEAVPEVPTAATPEAAVATAAPEVPVVPTAEQSLDDMVNQMVNKAQAANAQTGQPGVTLPQPPAPAISEAMMPPTGPSLPPVQVSDVPVPEMTQPMGAVDMGGVNTAGAASPAPTPAEAQQDDSAVVGMPDIAPGTEAAPEPVNPVIVQPVSDPGAFKIPGM